MESEICLVYSTFGNLDDAKRVGKTLVEERLAACVNIIPKIHSFYWWKEKIEEDEESILIAKITSENADKVVERIRELHPYELPAILVIPLIKVLKDFADYVKSETS